MMEKREIHLSDGRHAQVVLAPLQTSASALAQTLDLPYSQAVILLAGGAAFMKPALEASLQLLFTEGLASAAAALDALIIDGGTDSGVMALMGQGAAVQEHKPILLGVAPAGKVNYPGKIGSAEENGPLASHHSYFVLVETDEWGGETAMMYELAHYLARDCPSVAVLVNGGEIAKNELLYNVRQKRPIIIIEGSGRLANDIANLWRERERKALPSDQLLAEVVKDGDIYLFPLTGTAQQLQQLLFNLLQR